MPKHRDPSDQILKLLNVKSTSSKNMEWELGIFELNSRNLNNRTLFFIFNQRSPSHPTPFRFTPLHQPPPLRAAWANYFRMWEPRLRSRSPPMWSAPVVAWRVALHLVAIIVTWFSQHVNVYRFGTFSSACRFIHVIFCGCVRMSPDVASPGARCVQPFVVDDARDQVPT